LKTLYSFYKGFGVFLLLSIFNIQMNAQDIHFSQFGNAPINLSPALTGIFGGDVRFVGNYRSQWDPSVSYLNFSGAADMKFDKFCSNHDQWAGGLIFNYDQAGDSKLSTTQVALNGSYTHRVNNNNFMTLGVQLSGYQRAFSTENLEWGSQFGVRTFDPNRASGENYTDESIFYGDFSVGLNYHFQKPNSQGSWNNQNRTKFDLGVGLFHINQPNKSFYDDDEMETLPMRLAIYGLGTFRLIDPLDLVLVGMYQGHGPHQEIVVGLGAKIHLINELTSQLNVLFGVNFRLGDAIIPNVEVGYNSWKFGLSYDWNTSGFNEVTNGRGGIELSAAYIFVKPQLNTYRNCNPIY